MTEYAQILAAGTAPAPLDYTVPNAQELVPLAINAVIDGTAAATPFLATVEIISDGGVVIARCPITATIAAGASAEVSWFPLRRALTTSAPASAYAALITGTPGIKWYYKQDETSGTTMVDSGAEGKNGVYTNGPTLGQPPLADGTAVAYSAALSQRGFVSSTKLATGFTGPLSVECWVKTTQAGAGNPQFVCCDNNGQRLFQLRLDGTGKAQFIVFDSSAVGNSSLLSAAAVNDGVRHHLVGTLDAAKNQLIYVDGALSNSKATGLADESTLPAEVTTACRFHAAIFDSFYTGTIDEVAIYNAAITSTEVAQHYAARTP